MLKKFARYGLLVALSACLCSCNEDGDGVFFVMPEEPVWLMENGGSQAVSVGFHENSAAVVQVSVSISDPARLGMTGNSVISFLPGQTATFSNVDFACIDNAVQDGDVTVTVTFMTVSSDSAFDGLSQSIQILCSDDDAGSVDPGPVDPGPVDPGPVDPGRGSVIVTPASLTTYETGTTASVNVSLSAAPTDQVLIPVRSSDTSEGTVNTASLMFDGTNWNVPQVITVSSVDDHEIDGNVTYDITLGPVQSADPQYSALTVESIHVTNVDNDATATASMVVSTNSLRVLEGGKSTFYISAGTQPTASVNVQITVSDSSEGKVSTSSVVFATNNWDIRQAVTLSGLRDGQGDGDQDYLVEFKVTSADSRFDNLFVAPISATTVDTEGVPAGSSNILEFRAVAANITSGDHQSYSPGHGIRIFQAIKPDIVMIQEFNMYSSSGDDSDANIRKLVDQAFGTEFKYHRGRGQIPNGIISRYDIIDSGYWKSNKQSNRDWDWAIIDLPGPKELMVISVHLGTDTSTQEAPSLMSAMNKKHVADKQNKLDYFLMIGGDFNRNFQGNGSLDDYFNVDVKLPVDQENDETTNKNRKKVLDHLFVDKAFNRFEIPCEIGQHKYYNGHVFDSRVYSKNGELADVKPVQANDSSATNMQHMAVIRDFRYIYE